MEQLTALVASVYVCVCVCACVCISFHRKGFSWLKQKCNARDQASDVVLRKLLCQVPSSPRHKQP